MDKETVVTFPSDGETKTVHEEREEISWMSGEYLSAACAMVAWQFIDEPADSALTPKNLVELAERATYLMRQHCPLAYAYFFQNNVGDNPLPTGTLQIVLDAIRKERPIFLGGAASGTNYID